ncbi:MAG: hypothetical protein IJG24_03560 [Selenomonadaceae bacterium]|nr:hypothetical protein [Selenomonadaceae bacterium]
MATKTSLIINAVNEGKTLQKAIADVNPSATNAELKAFAQGMLGLTDYTYTNGALVERTDIDGNTNDLPLPTHSFWLGDTRVYSILSIAELIADTANVTHENGRLKFKLEVRDVYADEYGTPLAGSSPFTFAHDGYDNITDLRMLHYYDKVTESSTYGKWVLDCDIPDTLPSPSYFVRIWQAATRYSRSNNIDLHLKA